MVCPDVFSELKHQPARQDTPVGKSVLRVTDGSLVEFEVHFTREIRT